jgi:hypothetical protein
MENLLALHMLRLRVACGGMLAGLLPCVAVVLLVPPRSGQWPQAEALLWGFAFLAALNFVTVMPVYRAMLAGPRRVYGVGHQPGPLLTAHFAAHLVAYGRIEAVALLGLALNFVTGRADWCWAFLALSAAGMALLWPRAAKVEALLNAPSPRPA